MRKGIRGNEGNCSGHKTSLPFGDGDVHFCWCYASHLPVGTLDHLINDFSWDFPYFDCFLRPLPLFPSSHLFLPLILFPFLYIFQSSLPQVSSKEELEIVIINHLVFNWVLINICGLRSHPSLRISGGVMKVYIILTPSPKRKHYGLGQITCQHYANV